MIGPKDHNFVFVRGRPKPGSKNYRPTSASKGKPRGGERKVIGPKDQLFVFVRGRQKLGSKN